jgi:hypothetical protein
MIGINSVNRLQKRQEIPVNFHRKFVIIFQIVKGQTSFAQTILTILLQETFLP